MWISTSFGIRTISAPSLRCQRYQPKFPVCFLPVLVGWIRYICRCVSDSTPDSCCHLVAVEKLNTFEYRPIRHVARKLEPFRTGISVQRFQMDFRPRDLKRSTALLLHPSAIFFLKSNFDKQAFLWTVSLSSLYAFKVKNKD